MQFIISFAFRPTTATDARTLWRPKSPSQVFMHLNPARINLISSSTDLPDGGHGGPPAAVRPHPEDAGLRALRADIAGRGPQAPLLRPRAPLPEARHLQMICSEATRLLGGR